MTIRLLLTVFCITGMVSSQSGFWTGGQGMISSPVLLGGQLINGHVIPTGQNFGQGFTTGQSFGQGFGQPFGQGIGNGHDFSTVHGFQNGQDFSRQDLIGGHYPNGQGFSTGHGMISGQPMWNGQGFSTEQLFLAGHNQWPNQFVGGQIQTQQMGPRQTFGQFNQQNPWLIQQNEGRGSRLLSSQERRHSQQPQFNRDFLPQQNQHRYQGITTIQPAPRNDRRWILQHTNQNTKPSTRPRTPLSIPSHQTTNGNQETGQQGSKIPPCMRARCPAGLTCQPVSDSYRCIRPVAAKPCLLPPAIVGPCRAILPRYTYNKVRGKCERFNFGGCRGNDNNFITLKACERRCVK